jgi:RNA polymerase sigma-70 factor (ECF subfamily)
VHDTGVVRPRLGKVPAFWNDECPESLAARRPATVTVVDERLDLLLAEAKAGNRSAFARFIRATNREVWGFCMRIAGPADADDATQETYLALWKSLGSYRGESSARTWLFVIARRSASKIARERRRWAELAGKVPLPPDPPPAALAVEIEETLARLDLERRTAIVLTQMLGFSYAEAAVICECPVGTIRSRVARAREAMLEDRASTSRQAG